MKPLPGACFLGSFLVACATPAGGRASFAPPDVSTTSAAAPAEVVGLEVRAPSRVRYSPTVLGVPRTPVSLVVTNRTSRELDVSTLRLRFAATREGVSFSCYPDGGPTFAAREPASLAPGAAFAFERWLDCELPLAGTYELRPSVTFGRDARALGVPPVMVRVFAPRSVDPEPIDDRGLFVAVGTSTFVASRPGRGSASAAVAVINGSTRTLSTPRIRLLTRVRRDGSPVACVGEPVGVDAPSALAPGAVHREHVDIPCVGLDRPGVYAIDVRVLLDETREVPFGTLRVEVSRDRSTLDPRPWL